MGLPYPQNILCANLIGGLPRRDQVKAGFVLGLFQNNDCVHVGVAGCVCVCVCVRALVSMFANVPEHHESVKACM